MTEMKKLWGPLELATRLGTTRRTINTMRWQMKRGIIGANRLPPPLACGGDPRWDPEAVEAWIRANAGAAQESSESNNKPRVGRKRRSSRCVIRLY